MIINATKYSIILYNQEQSFIERYWKPTSNDLNEEQYNALNAKFFDFASCYKPKRLLIDKRNCLYRENEGIHNDLLSNVIETFVSYGTKRIALLVSNDVYLKLSVGQVIDEYNGKRFVRQYFDDLDTAKEWLLI